MQIAEIKVSELPDFLTGTLWEVLSPKPITLMRAVSQFRNPRANLNDIALIIAYENNILLGLVGLLPDLVNGQPASSNSCWWIHPEKGKHLAIPLFLKAFASCHQRMFMTDCTPHTRAILEKTNWFYFPETAPGIRGFLKFNLHELIPAKFPLTKNLKPILELADQTLNFLFAPFHWIQGFRIRKVDFQVEYLTSLSPELHEFIKIHSQNEFIRRSGTDLEWIIQNQWIKQKTTTENKDLIKYPFSYLVGGFEQYFLKISESGKTIGLLFISVRDGHMKVPYSYFPENEGSKILRVIYQQAIQKKSVSLTFFSPKLVKKANSETHPFLFRKKIKRLIAISTQLTEIYREYPVIQDGDGDVVFT